MGGNGYLIAHTNNALLYGGKHRPEKQRVGSEPSPLNGVLAWGCCCLQRAAMTQSALAKERRELKDQQQRTMMEAVPKDLNRPWEDPMPETGERHLAQELRGVGA